MVFCRMSFGLSVPKWICTAAIAATVALGANYPSYHGLGNLVVVGDSLSAGYQNDQLIDCRFMTTPPTGCLSKPSGQSFGYANVIASQSGQESEFNVPFIVPPGYPQITITDGFALVTGATPTPRESWTQTLDASVPGYTLAAAAGYVPLCPPNPSAPASSAPPYPIQVMALEILNPADFAAYASGSPTCPSTTPTELAEGATLAAENPGTAILWLGSNDALFPLLFANEQPTSPFEFAYLYNVLISTMAQTSGHLVVANIPDVTKLPYLTPAPAFAAQVGRSLAELGLTSSDYVTPYAFAVVGPGTLPATATVGGQDVPIIFTNSQIQSIRTAVDLYNIDIAIEALIHHATLVDIHGLVDQIAANGYSLGMGKITLTTAFGGGLFSLDGVHPTNTGYAIIANQFINTMNHSLGSTVPPVSVADTAANDPLVPATQPPFPPQVKMHVSRGMADGLRDLMRTH